MIKVLESSIYNPFWEISFEKPCVRNRLLSLQKTSEWFKFKLNWQKLLLLKQGEKKQTKRN